MCPRLTLADAFAKQSLERVHVVVLELPDGGSAEPHAKADRRVVVLVRDDEASLIDEGRDGRRVCSETHRDDHRILGAEELRDELLRLSMKVERACVQPRTARRDTVPPDGRLDRVRAPARRLRKPEVIVRRDVERARGRPCELPGVIVVGRGAVVQHDRAAGDAGRRAREAVVEALLEPAGVERVKVGVERSVALSSWRRGGQGAV